MTSNVKDLLLEQQNLLRSLEDDDEMRSSSYAKVENALLLNLEISAALGHGEYSLPAKTLTVERHLTEYEKRDAAFLKLMSHYLGTDGVTAIVTDDQLLGFRNMLCHTLGALVRSCHHKDTKVKDFAPVRIYKDGTISIVAQRGSDKWDDIQKARSSFKTSVSDWVSIDKVTLVNMLIYKYVERTTTLHEVENIQREYEACYSIIYNTLKHYRLWVRHTTSHFESDFFLFPGFELECDEASTLLVYQPL